MERAFCRMTKACAGVHRAWRNASIACRPADRIADFVDFWQAIADELAEQIDAFAHPDRIRKQYQARRAGRLVEQVHSCAAVLYRPEMERNLEVCPKCGHHHYIGARQRLWQWLDADSAVEIAAELEPVDALRFKDQKRYKDRIVAAQKQTGEKDALIAVRGTLKGMAVAACAFEFATWVDRWARSWAKSSPWQQRPHCRTRPLVCFSATGGRACRKACFR